MNPAAPFASSKEARKAALERQIQELFAQHQALNEEEEVWAPQQSSAPLGGRQAQYSGPPANHPHYAPQHYSHYQPVENTTAPPSHNYYHAPVSVAQTSYRPQPPSSQSTHQQHHPRTMQEDLRMSIVPPAASRIQALPNTASSTSGSACAPQRGTNGPQRPPATTQHQHTTVPQQQHPSAPQQQYQQPPQQQHRPPAPQSGPSGRTVALQSDNHASRPPQPSRPQPQASSHQPSPSNASLPATTPEHTEAIAAHIAHARVLNPPLEGIYQVLLESDEGIRNYIFNSAVDTVPWGDYRDLAFFWDVVNGQKTVSMLIGIKTEGSPISYIPDFRSRAAAAYRRFGLPAPRRTLNPKSSSSIPAGQSSSNNAPSSSSSVPPPAQQTTSPSSTAPIPNGRPSVLGPPQAAKATTSIASSSHSPPPAASSNTISTMALAPGKAAAPSNAPVPTKGPAPAKAPAPVKAPAQTNAIASGSGSGSGESAPVWPVPSATKASSPYVPAFIRNGVLTLEDPTPPKNRLAQGAGTQVVNGAHAANTRRLSTPVSQQQVASVGSTRGALSAEPVATPVRQMLQKFLSAPPPSGQFTSGAKPKAGLVVGSHIGIQAGYDKGKGKELTDGQALPSSLRPCDADMSTLARDVLRALGLEVMESSGSVTSDGASADGMSSPAAGSLTPQLSNKRPLADDDQEGSQPAAKRRAVDVTDGRVESVSQANVPARPIAIPTVLAPSGVQGAALSSGTLPSLASTLHGSSPDTAVEVKASPTLSAVPVASTSASSSTAAPSSAPSSSLLSRAPAVHDTSVTSLPNVSANALPTSVTLMNALPNVPANALSTVSVTALPIPPRPQNVASLATTTSLRWKPVQTNQPSGDTASASYPMIAFKAVGSSTVASTSIAIPTPMPASTAPSGAAHVPVTTPTPLAGSSRMASEEPVPFIDVDLEISPESTPLVKQRSQSRTSQPPTPRARVHQATELQPSAQAGSSKLPIRETLPTPSFGAFATAKNPFVDLGSMRKDRATASSPHLSRTQSIAQSRPIKISTSRKHGAHMSSGGSPPRATLSTSAPSTTNPLSIAVTPSPVSALGSAVASSTLVPTSPVIDTDAQGEGSMGPSSPAPSNTPVGSPAGGEPSELDSFGVPSQRLNKRKRSRGGNRFGAFVLVPPAPDWVKRVQRRTGAFDTDDRLGSSAEKARKEAGLSEYEKQTLSESLATLASKPCGWRNCTTLLNSSQSLRAHVKRHSDRVQHYPFLCSWSGCELKFAANDDLLKHLIRHSDRIGLDCPLIGCDARADTARQLLTHYSLCREGKDELHLKPRSVPHEISTGIATANEHGQDQGSMPVYLMEAPVVSVPSYHQGQEPWLRASIYGIPRCDENANIRPRRRRLEELLKTIPKAQSYASVSEPTIHTTYRSTPRKLLKSGFTVDIPVLTDPVEFYNSGGSTSDGRSQIDLDEHSSSRDTSLGAEASEPGASVSSGDDPLLITDERDTPSVDTGDEELAEVQDLLQEEFNDVDG